MQIRFSNKLIDSMKKKIAIVRGKFLNSYEMQYFQPLENEFDLVGFSSLRPLHNSFQFPTVKLPSPMDLPEFPYKMQLLNRIFVDAHYLFGLENKLKRFDLVHTAETYFHFTHQSLIAKQKGFVKKVIATVSENIPFNNEGIWGRRGFKEFAIKYIDYFIAISNQAREALILEGADAKKITIIGHGIDTKTFTPKNNIAKNTESKHITILFCGRIEKEKGVYEIVYAAKKLLSDETLHNYSLQFVFVGIGAEEKKLLELEKRLSIDSKITHKQSNYSEMPNEYKNADIFIAPSREDGYWREQFSMVLLEAQSCGLPIVTTNSGAIPENVADAALLIPPGDFISLADAIRKFILSSQLRYAYAKRARERAIRIHGAALAAKKLSKVYNEILQ